MGKRANGEGWIARYKYGRWCSRCMVHTANGPKRKALYGKSKAEVRAKLTKGLAERDSGLVFEVENPAVKG